MSGHEEGAQAPFPPVWEGDPYTGHHRSCGVRVKINCTCGMVEWLSQQNEFPKYVVGRRAELPLALAYVQGVLNLPDDVHIVGARIEPITGEFGNLILDIEAFADNTFPGTRVTAKFHNEWDVRVGEMKVIFDGWESID